MATRLDHRLFSDQLPSLSMPLDTDMDADILNMDWLGNLSKESMPWDPPAPCRNNYGYNFAYDYKSDDLDSFLDLDQPKAFSISADSENYLDLEDILSSISPRPDAQPLRKSLSGHTFARSDTPARNHREFQDRAFKSRKQSLLDTPLHIMGTDLVSSPYNMNMNINATGNRRSPSLSTSTDTEPNSPISSTSSTTKTQSNRSKKTNPSPTRRRRGPATTTTFDDSDNDVDSQEYLLKKKKAAHNIIEKRYRTNMNAKFSALGNALPSGPANNSSQKSPSGERSNNRKGSGGSSGCSQNKSDILSNALTYIHQLQEENGSLKGEMLVLKENLLPRGMVRQQRGQR